jgi:hypothetical protein
VRGTINEDANLAVGVLAIGDVAQRLMKMGERVRCLRLLDRYVEAERVAVGRLGSGRSGLGTKPARARQREQDVVLDRALTSIEPAGSTALPFREDLDPRRDRVTVDVLEQIVAEQRSLSGDAS